MSFSISPNLPANVVEIGNELSQARLDAINNGIGPTAGNPFTTVSYITGLSYLTTTSAASTYATKASPTFTGTVTIPAGASISGYLTTSSAAITYQTISGMISYATQSYVTSQGYLTDAPSNGSEYVRKNGAWSVATGGGGGGGLTISSLSNSAATTLNATVPTTGQALTFDGTELAWATVGGGGGGVAWGGITGTVTNQTDLTSYISGLGYLTSVPAKTLNTVSSHTLVAGDENKVHWLNGGMSGSTLTIPADSTYAFPNATEITVVCDDTSMSNMVIAGQYAGQPTINGAPSVTLSQKVGKLVKVATDTWLFA